MHIADMDNSNTNNSSKSNNTPNIEKDDSVPELIQFFNEGPKLISTNYWGSEMERKGFFHVNINAGVMRLLVPRCRFNTIAEMKTGKIAVISFGRNRGLGHLTGSTAKDLEMSEIMFEDYSDSPFTLFLCMEQWMLLPAKRSFNERWKLSVWSFDGKQPKEQFIIPAYLRNAPIPCLESWV